MFSAKDQWTLGEVAVRGGHEWRNYRERVQKGSSSRGAGKRDWESVLPVGEGRVWKE